MTDEKVYNIPLRRVFSKTSRLRKSSAAVKAVREFVSRALRTSDVTINPDINEFIWSRGISHPPAQVRVKVRKDGNKVFADLVDTSKYAEKKASAKAAKAEASKSVEKSEKKTEASKPVEKAASPKPAHAEKKAEAAKEAEKAAA